MRLSIAQTIVSKIMLQNGNYFWQMVTQAASKKRWMLSILSYKKPSLISYLKTK
jgi:hypothetical protein